MSAVEFLDPDEHTEPRTDAPGVTGANAAPAAQPLPGRLVLLADAVLSLVGAALLVTACFRSVFSINLASDEGPNNYEVDGWGRLRLTGGDIAGQHSARVGIVLCVAAGLVLLGLALRALPRRRDAPRVGRALTLLAAGAAAAVAGNAILDGTAALDSYRAAISGELELSPGQRGPALPTVHFGGFVWLAGIGAVCVMLALVSPAVAGVRARARTRAAPHAGARALPELTADDEQL